MTQETGYKMLGGGRCFLFFASYLLFRSSHPRGDGGGQRDGHHQPNAADEATDDLFGDAFAVDGEVPRLRVKIEEDDER